MENPLISVIIPVFNIEGSKSLRSLIRILKRQNPIDFEVLICDDGSEDNTIDYCLSLTDGDYRFKVVKCRHQGVSATRNKGIDMAKGRWITFVDSDDLVTPSFLNPLLQQELQDIDFIVFSYGMLTNEGIKLNIFEDNIYSGEYDVREALIGSDILHRCSPWGKFYKKEIINSYKIRFEEGLFNSEDRLFIYQYIQHISSIASNSNLGYIYESTSSTSLKHKKMTVDEIKKRQQLLSTESERVMSAFGIGAQDSFKFNKQLLYLLKDAYLRILRNKDNKHDTIEFQKEIIEEYLTKDWLDSINQDERMMKYISSDIILKQILEGKFKELNSFIKRKDFIIGVKRTIVGILSKNKSNPTFESHIQYY